MSGADAAAQTAAEAVCGTWDLVVATPVGRLPVVLTLQAPAPGAWSGTAEGAGETVVLEDVAVRAEGMAHRVTWTQTTTRPLRLRLQFDVLVSSDALDGSSRAGRLPRSTVTGTRR